MIAHFDGDLIVYRAGFAAEKMHYYVMVHDEEYDDDVAHHFQYKKDTLAWIEEQGLLDGTYTIEQGREVEPVRNALYNVRSLVNTVLENLSIPKSDMRMYLSGPTNFRDGVATLKPYKGNRDPEHKPIHGPAIKEYMAERYNAIFSEDEEADDLVGRSHYQMYKEDPFSSVIVSTDKDLDMIPGLHYNFVKDESYMISDEEAERVFMRQLLTGDSTDNIPGVPGIGPAKAAKAINFAKNPWDDIVTLYVQGYGEEKWYEALEENGRLLWIRREKDEFWSPPYNVRSRLGTITGPD